MMNKINNTVKLLAASLFLLFSISAVAQEDTLSFLHITDSHVIFNQDVYHPDMMEYRKTKQYHLGESRLRYVLQNVPEKTNSDFVIITGDMVDYFEAETRKNDMVGLQVVEFSRLLNDYHIPILLTLGNHDAFTFKWRDGKLLPSQDFVGRARADWIRNIDCFKDGTYYSKIHQVGKTTFRLIFLDDLFYRFRKEEKIDAYINKSEYYWLKQQLNESQDDIEIILMHIPLPENVVESEFPNDLYSELKQHASCKLIFAGHCHKNRVLRFPSEEGFEIIQVETGALVNNPDNWRQVRLTEDNILVSFPGSKKRELVIPVK